MDTLSSKEFRRQYARLTEPTVVTVNGHPIGTWLPHQFPQPTPLLKDEIQHQPAVQFRPAPKPGKGGTR